MGIVCKHWQLLRQDTAAIEMHRLLDLVAEQGREIASLRLALIEGKHLLAELCADEAA